MSDTRPTKSSASARRALLLAGLPVLLALGAARSPFAQSVPAQVYGPGHRGHHAYVGPIAPAVLRDSIGVSGAKLEQYTKLYDRHIAATKPIRDSLQTEMRSSRTAFQRGDSTAAQADRQAIKRQSEALAKQDQKFDAGLKDLLTQDQQKKYAKWREEQMDLARARWHRERSEHGRDEAKPQG